MSALAALGSVLVLAGPAQVRAANAVVNPGFESNCAGVPCSWFASGDSTVARDTTNPHAGAASLRIDDSTDPGEAITVCVQAFGNGTYTASFFYRTASAGVDSVRLTVNFYSDSTCTAGLGSGGTQDPPIIDGAWHETIGTIVAPAGTNSVELRARFTCTGACPVLQTVNFDDLSLVRTNAVPNPNFESNCAGVPCNWTALGDSTASRDTANLHAGAASLRIDDSTEPAQAVSDCLTVAGSGTYGASYFYRTTSTGLGSVKLTVNFFSGEDCTGSLGDESVNDTAASDGVWHLVTGTIMAPSGTNSAQVVPEFNCFGACGGTKTVNFDDLTLVRSNTVLNPGFELNCAGVPCNWNDGDFGSTVSRDTSSPHAGSASLRVDDPSDDGAAGTDCVTGMGGGTYKASFFFRTTSGVSSIHFLAVFYPTLDCSAQAGANDDVIVSPVNQDGLWHQLVGEVVAPSGTHSAKIRPSFTASGAASRTVNFDDLVLDGSSGGTTAVTLEAFTARPSGQAVVLSWRTGTEARTLGFELRRGKAQVGRLISARGIGASTYRFVDRSARRGRTYDYTLVAVGLDGSRKVLGSARVRR